MGTPCFSQVHVHRDKPRTAVWVKLGRVKLELV